MSTTTIRLPEELKVRVERLAAARVARSRTAGSSDEVTGGLAVIRGRARRADRS